MIAADTSVVVAALASWHPAHAVAADAIRAGARPTAHTVLETYSVLTRLPEEHRLAADVVGRQLAHTFPDGPLALPVEAQRTLVADLLTHGVTGGAVYDGLVALTARAHAADLVTLDVRAMWTYRRLGVAATAIA